MTEVLFISLIHLIQHPDEYNQKHIRVIGFASLDFEGKAVYVSKDDYDHAITKNAIWLDIELTEEVKSKKQKYVLVEGVFDRDNLGHLKLFSGTINHIARLEVWENMK